MKDLNWKAVVMGVAIVVALFGVFKGTQHAWQDHTTIHFTAGLLEAVRQAVLEVHPELADDTPPPPTPAAPPPVEETPE